MFIKRFRKSKKGATAIEYAIIASMLSVVIIVGLEATGLALGNTYNTTSAKLEDAFEASAGNSGSSNIGGGGKSPNIASNPDGL